ncbi:MAG: alkaline phosphatase family protein [Polyangiales bacterium]
MPRVLLIGLDSVPPRLAFERYRSALPHLDHLMRTGCYGPLRSTVPPITVPAWACMLSGYDPGQLGLYGFRNRQLGSYQLRLVTSRDLNAAERPMLWDRLRPEQHACVMFVPPSFPPRSVQGELVSCFLTPDAASPHTSPPALAVELRERFGPYQPDVDEYRTDDRARLLAQLQAGTRQRFAIAEHLVRTRRPDLGVMVEVGPDRFHHAFWSHIVPEDPRHEPGNPWETAGLAYYRLLDEGVGALLRAAGDDTAVFVVSDHGVRPLYGCIHVNQWLIDRGYLVLTRQPEVLTPFSQLEVDWSRTRAFGEGGYHARIMLNVMGREPAGCVPSTQVDALCEQLARELAELPGPRGERLAHHIARPAACYREVRGLPPDLMVFFDDLNYRASGSVGGGVLYSADNDTGPDACNHDWDGIFIAAGPGIPARGPLTDLNYADVAVTALNLLGLPATDLAGRDVRGVA